MTIRGDVIGEVENFKYLGSFVQDIIKFLYLFSWYELTYLKL
jgi:hypothetical protein